MPGYPCCCGEMFTDCGSLIAYLDTASSVDVTLQAKNGTTGCTGCAVWSGTYNFTPTAFPGTACPTLDNCFEYSYSGLNICGSPSSGTIYTGWRCITGAGDNFQWGIGVGSSASGIWRRQSNLTFPVSLSAITSGIMLPDSIAGFCLPDGNATYQFNF